MCVFEKFATGLVAGKDSHFLTGRNNYRSGFGMTTDLTMPAWTGELTLYLAFPYVLATIQQYGVIDALTYRADGKPLDD